MSTIKNENINFQSKDIILEENNLKEKQIQGRGSIKWLDNLRQSKRQSYIDNDEYNNRKKELKFEEMIELAKIHREANRPLIKIKEFDGQTKFCQCCHLPSNDNIYLKAYSFCDNTDKFAEFGRGTSLYFSFYRFSTLILFFALISMALPSFLLTNYYTNQITDLCYQIYIKEKESISVTFPGCVNFINVNGISKIFIKDTDWEFKYNGINLLEYRNIYKKLTNSYDNVEKVLINYNIVYFIGIFTLFVINLLYIIILYNINIQYDISVTTPSDYTIIISNLSSAFNIFWKKINKINSYVSNIIKILGNSNEGNKSESKNINPLKIELEEIEELGLEDYPITKEINILDAFYEFIKNRICESSDGEKFNIYQINICYKINEFMKKEENIQNLKSEIYKINYHPKQIKKNEQLRLKDRDRKFFYNPLDVLDLNILNCKCCEKYHLLSDLEDEEKELEKQLKELLKQTENLTEDNFSGVIFVIFNNIQEQENFLKPFPKNLIMNILVSIKNMKYFLCCCCIDKKKRKRFFLRRNMAVDVAPEPEDVIFENLQYSAIERLFRTLFIFLVSLIIIFVCFIIILALNYLQIKHKTEDSDKKVIFKYIVSFVITLVISGLNSFFLYVLNYLTKKEKHISMTNYYLSFSIKLTLFTFITSGVIPLISCHYYNSKSHYDILVANMLTLFLSNSFLTPIMWSMNFEFLYKKIKICLVEKNHEYYTQKELNNLYELLDMEIASKYSYIAKTLLMTFLYMPIFPISVFISLAGFVFGYFIEKFNFSKIYKRPEMLNSKICEFYSNYFILNFFMLCIGDYVFIKDVNKENIWPLFNLIFFGVLILIPYNQIFSFDFIGIKESDLKKDEAYEDCYYNFYNDYERTNPMTKKEGVKHFFKKLSENGLISQNHYKIIIDNFENINLMETYYKARKNFNNSLIQRVFLNLGKNNWTNKKKRKSRFIENFKQYFKNNGEKILNFLLGNHDKNEENNEINKNNIYIENENIDKTKLGSSISLKMSNDKTNSNINNIEVYPNDKIYRNNIEKSERSDLKKRSQKFLNNFMSKEQNNILNLYSNPLFFGIKLLCESISLNNNDETEEEKKKEENQEEKKKEEKEEKEKEEKELNNIIEIPEKKEKKKKRKKKKKKKTKKEPEPIVVSYNIQNEN